MHLDVKLRDGFKDDTVVIEVDGREVYQRSGVNTDLTISFADGLNLELPGPTIHLEVAVTNGPRASQEIDLRETPFVGLWRSEAGLEIRATADEVPML